MRFDFLRKLGEGSMGTVYEAIDRETRATVAVKELKPGILPPAHELLLARRVTHRNVCRVHELHREAGKVFISMEFIDGQPLKGPLPAAERIPIAKQICAGVSAIHREQIVHGDLKPGNIMVANDGTVKVMDFGLARLTDPEATAGIPIAGTPEYMAPELKNGGKPNIASDIYALGVVLKKLGLRGPVVSRCLNPNPAKRFASAEGVSGALDAPASLFRPVPGAVHLFLAGSLIAAVTAVAFVGLSVRRNLPPTFPAGPAAPAIAAKPSLAVLFEEDGLIRALLRDGTFQLVERAQLDKVLAELELNGRKEFDRATALRIGKLVGAKYLLLGGQQAPGRRTARLIVTETGEIVAAEPVGEKEPNLTALVKRLGEAVEK